MKLHTRLKKTVAMAAVAGMVVTAMPVATFASDYTGHWAETAIENWKEKGIIDGYEDGTFKPKNEVTRAELAKMLSEVFGLTNKEGAEKFTDVQSTNWHNEYVQLVSAAGLMTGTNGEFRPNAPATREEAAYALATAYHITGDVTGNFATDQASISAWATDAVEALVANGYIAGYPDGTFKPQGSLTRAEVVVMLDRMTAEIVNQTGTYTQDTQGNLVVNTKDVVLKDMIINGNLYLAEGIGEGDVTLDGVTVTGDVIVEGGGINSVHIKGKSNLKDILVSKAGTNPVRLVVSGTANITGNVTVDSPTVLEGTAAKLGKVILNAATLELKGTITVGSVEIQVPATLTLTGTGVVVDKVVVGPAAASAVLAGNGTIKELEVQVDGVKYASGLTIDKITVAEGITAPDKTSTSTGGGGGGGGGGSVTTPTMTLGDATITLANGAPVTVDLSKGTITVDATGENVLINGTAFTPDMQIESAKAAVSTTNVTVSIIPGTLDDVTLTANKDYTIADLAKIVADKEDNVREIIASFVTNGYLTDTQAKKVEVYFDKALEIFSQSANDKYVNVSSIQHYILSAKAKLNEEIEERNTTLEELAQRFASLLNLADVTVLQDGDVITVNVTLKLEGSDESHKDIKVTLKF